MKNLEVLFSLLILITALYTAIDLPETGRNYQTTISEVIDGDTLEVTGEIDTTVRLLGVDSAEIHSATNPEEFNMKDTLENRECLKKWGIKAKNYTKKKTGGRNISIHLDQKAERRGEYGRLLAYIKFDNKTLNRQLIRKGLARVYTSSFTRLQEYRKLEAYARKRNKGLWSCSN
ncbi:MAG: thermonuclease family protein [Candidatus Nanosalina sp.]